MQKPSLYISLKNDTGKAVPGTIVRLYKSAGDTGLRQVADSNGLVYFTGLDTGRYHWLAVNGCKTNLGSQTRLDRSFVSNIVYYGYSVMTETGTVKIINNAPQPYKISDSVVNITVSKDTPYIAHRRVRSLRVRSELVNSPGTVKDTLLQIRCGDTTVLNLPY